MELNKHGPLLRCAILLTTALLAGPPVIAQAATITQQTDGVTIKTATDTLRLTVCNSQVLHVVASPEGKVRDATPQQPWMVESCTPSKFTLTLPAERPTAPVEAPPVSPAPAILNTGSIKVLISLDSGYLQFNDEHDQRILKETHDSPRRYEEVTANGEAFYRVSDRFSLPAEEGIYGLGQHQNGVFNYRGTVIELAQINTDVAIPLLVSTKGYGLFWNSAAKSYFDNRFPSEMRVSAEAAHGIDYYFIYGPEIDQIIHEYRNLTGHAPLFAKWAYGFFQSKDRYKSGVELLNVAGEYRSQHVPLDVIVQDWFWWVRQGDPEFRADAYPRLEDTLQALHGEHLHAMVSIWSLFDSESTNYKEMLARGLTILCSMAGWVPSAKTGPVFSTYRVRTRSTWRETPVSPITMELPQRFTVPTAITGRNILSSPLAAREMLRACCLLMYNACG